MRFGRSLVPPDALLSGSPRLPNAAMIHGERAHCMESARPSINVVVLGSTGSIGRSALSVIEHDGGARLRAWGLSGHTRWRDLAAQAAAHRPRYVAATD